MSALTRLASGLHVPAVMGLTRKWRWGIKRSCCPAPPTTPPCFLVAISGMVENAECRCSCLNMHFYSRIGGSQLFPSICNYHHLSLYIAGTPEEWFLYVRVRYVYADPGEQDLLWRKSIGSGENPPDPWSLTTADNVLEPYSASGPCDNAGSLCVVAYSEDSSPCDRVHEYGECLCVGDPPDAWEVVFADWPDQLVEGNPTGNCAQMFNGGFLCERNPVGFSLNPSTCRYTYLFDRDPNDRQPAIEVFHRTWGGYRIDVEALSGGLVFWPGLWYIHNTWSIIDDCPLPCRDMIGVVPVWQDPGNYGFCIGQQPPVCEITPIYYN